MAENRSTLEKVVMKLHLAVFYILALSWGGKGINAQTLEVSGQSPFKTLQMAISAANSGDTIRVKAGNYPQVPILIEKPLTLIADGKVIIDAANQKREIFLVKADSVEINGFTLRGVGVSYRTELSAIKVIESGFARINNNLIQDCFFAIYLQDAHHCIVQNNNILGAAVDESKAGNAIHLWKCNHIIVKDNYAEGHRDGIYFEFVDNSIIERNTSQNNLRYGLHFMFSNDDEYVYNEFNHNGTGVAVMFSRRIEMRKNVFRNNWGESTYGLLLKEISDGLIADNLFYHNTTGLLGEGANRLSIERNTFRKNGVALDIKGNCLDNVFSKNNFLSNTFEVVTNSRYNNNTYEKNFWGQFQGYDLDRDGFGDEPYRPVNIFGKITNEIPSATILLYSFFVDLLTLSERVLPTVIPKELVDPLPKMKPYPYDYNK